MAEVTKSTVVRETTPDTAWVPVATTTTRAGVFDDFFVSKTNQIIFSIIGIIELLIVLRFALLLFAANRVGFVNFIISLTDVFVLPFAGIFPSPAPAEGAYLETASLVAIVMWLVIGLILTTIINIFSSRTDV